MSAGPDYESTPLRDMTCKNLAVFATTLGGNQAVVDWILSNEIDGRLALALKTADLDTLAFNSILTKRRVEVMLGMLKEVALRDKYATDEEYATAVALADNRPGIDVDDDGEREDDKDYELGELEDDGDYGSGDCTTRDESDYKADSALRDITLDCSMPDRARLPHGFKRKKHIDYYYSTGLIDFVCSSVNGTENEELAKMEARREEKWKENVETEQKEKREGTA
eukprot:g9531.t1